MVQVKSLLKTATGHEGTVVDGGSKQESWGWGNALNL